MTKARVIGLVAVILVAVLSITAWMDTDSVADETRLISVTGEAEVRVVPDEVILTLGVETWNKDLDLARRQNDQVVGRVLALSEEFGIASQYVQTDYVGIEPRYRNGYYEDRDFIGYFVHKTVVITVRDLTQFEALLAAALDAGVNYVHGIQFRTTELRQYRDEARALAIQAAQEKASALASELGQDVGEPQRIEEVHSGWGSGYNSWWGSRWGSGMSQNVIQEIGTGPLPVDGTLAPGQINVSATVAVAFVLK
jgi:uncharacterized protein YggE